MGSPSTTEAPSPSTSSRRTFVPRDLVGAIFRIRDLPILVVLIAIVGIVTAFHPTYFRTASLINTSQYAAYIGSMAVGMVFLLSMREIDLSVGIVYGLSAIVAARLMEGGMSPWFAALSGVVTGCACGALNGLIANSLRVQTIIVTLGTLSMYTALALIVSKDQVIVDLPTNSSFFRVLGGTHYGLPMSIWTFIILTVVGHTLYRHTRFGSQVRIIGSNPEAARVLGLRVARVRLAALMFQGLMASIIGVVTFAYLQAADPTTGVGYELAVIAAAIVGGTALSGGQGSVIGAAIGALVISSISTGLVQFGVTADWTGFATGAIIIGAVALDSFLRRRRVAVAT